MAPTLRTDRLQYKEPPLQDEEDDFLLLANQSPTKPIDSSKRFHYSFSDRFLSRSLNIDDLNDDDDDDEDPHVNKDNDLRDGGSASDGNKEDTFEISLSNSDYMNPSSPCRNLHIITDESTSSLMPSTSPPPKRRVALLALDLQNDFLGDHDATFFFGSESVRRRGESGEQHPFAGRREPLLSRIQDLAHQVRAQDGVVCFVKSQYRGSRSSCCCAAGSAGSAFHPDAANLLAQLQRDDEDDSNNVWVLTKQWYSAFLETVLHCQLQRLGVEDLIITGVTTNHSVAATVRSASHLGYRVILSTDGTAQLDPKLQESTCEQLSGFCHKLLPSGGTVEEFLREEYEQEEENLVDDDEVLEARDDVGSPQQGHHHKARASPSVSPEKRMIQEKLQEGLIFDGCVRLSGLGAGDSLLIPDILNTPDDILRDLLLQMAKQKSKSQEVDWKDKSAENIWRKTLKPAKERIEKQAGHSMNWSKINWQQRGSNSSSPEDDEDDEETEEKPCTPEHALPACYSATLLLGEGRILQFQPKMASNVLPPQTVYVHHNSLLLVGPETSRLYNHALFARKKKHKSRAPRISVTFASVRTTTSVDPKLRPRESPSRKRHEGDTSQEDAIASPPSLRDRRALETLPEAREQTLEDEEGREDLNEAVTPRALWSGKLTLSESVSEEVEVDVDASKLATVSEVESTEVEEEVVLSGSRSDELEANVELHRLVCVQDEDSEDTKDEMSTKPKSHEVVEGSATRTFPHAHKPPREVAAKSKSDGEKVLVDSRKLTDHEEYNYNSEALPEQLRGEPSAPINPLNFVMDAGEEAQVPHSPCGEGKEVEVNIMSTESTQLSHTVVPTVDLSRLDEHAVAMVDSMKSATQSGGIETNTVMDEWLASSCSMGVWDGSHGRPPAMMTEDPRNMARFPISPMREPHLRAWDGTVATAVHNIEKMQNGSSVVPCPSSVFRAKRLGGGQLAPSSTPFTSQIFRSGSITSEIKVTPPRTNLPVVAIATKPATPPLTEEPRKDAPPSVLETFLRDTTVAVTVGASVMAVLTATPRGPATPTFGVASFSIAAACATFAWWKNTGLLGFPFFGGK